MYKIIAFDFDGTLVDSVDFCLSVFDLVFAKFMGKNAPDREDVYQNFGMNEPGVIKYYMGSRNPEAEAEFYRLHRELHAEMCPETFPDVTDFLKYLKSCGIRLTILTGRSETTCKISMDFLKLNEYFESFQTGSFERNDKAAQLRQLLAENDLKPEELLYIGDAVSDAQASANAGVECISAAWAKSARITELEKINPGRVFTTVKAMREYISGKISV